MGTSRFSLSSYQSTKGINSRSITGGYDHDAQNRAARPEDRKAAERVNPFGVKNREARDSTAHPNSVPIALCMDVTGSMRNVPKVLQESLGGIVTRLQAVPGLEDIQILMVAVGDGETDEVPMQIGQYESGNEMDDDLHAFYLEGNGGGNNGESYGELLYFLARNVVTDAWEKRHRKGYIILIADEPYHKLVHQSEMKEIFDMDIPGEVMTSDVIKECQVKNHVYLICPTYTSGTHSYDTIGVWSAALGEDHVIQVDTMDNITEVIANIVTREEQNPTSTAPVPPVDTTAPVDISW